MTSTFTLHPQLAKDCLVLFDLPLSRLLLCNDKNFPWFILVPRVENIQEIYQLTMLEQQQLLSESSMLSELLMKEFFGDKMNIAALGNVVPQLHIHHIVRFKTDPCWPKPIWGEKQAIYYSNDEIRAIKNSLIPKLEKAFTTTESKLKKKNNLL